MTRLMIDADQIRTFIETIFRHAADGQFVSLRTFEDTKVGERPLTIEAVEINGAGLAPVIDAAITQAQWAADHGKRTVFCPPAAGFNSPAKANEEHLVAGYTVSVDCDQRPVQAREKLEALLGPATLVVASGGEWTDPTTGEIQSKVHAHWVLARPATGDDLARLKKARRLATELVGGDPSNIPICHPIRWAGSVHRKGAPKLVQIISQTENEIDLDKVLAILEAARPEPEKPKDNPNNGAAGDPGAWFTVEPLLAEVATSEMDRSRRFQQAVHAAVQAGMTPDAFEALARRYHKGCAGKYAGRLRAEIARSWGKEREWASEDDEEQFGEDAGEPLFDPWSDYIVPSFPLDVLPPVVQRFVGDQSKVIGGDPSALAMLALSAMGGALDHRFRLKLLGNGNWYASPRLWVLLVGGVSFKKTPLINAALAPLEEFQNEIQREYWARLREYDAALATYDKKSGETPPEEPPKPPRFVVSDTTIEKLGELLARKPRGVLVKRDELAGWIGAMEKYGGRGAAASDRAFWLQSYDGGPYTIDRISRGELWIENLSTSVIGGIQPDRLAELTCLTTDGLLQRFIPVMMQAPAFPIDVDVSASAEGYRRLMRRMITADPCSLALGDDAKPVMEKLRRHIHELEQAAAGLARGFQGFIGKLPGMAGSLALILHLAENPHEQRMHPVSRRVAEKVERLVLEFVIPHAFEFYRTSETTTDGDRLQRLASWIVTSGKARITARDLTHNVRDMRGVGLRDVQLRVSPLVASGWITPVATGPENRAWDVSPAVARQFKARAEEEERRKAILAKLMASPRRPRQEAEW